MNFIEYYDNSLKKDYCDFIIKLYNKQNSQSSPTVNGINAKHKLGTHIPLSFENSKGWLNSSVNTYLSNSLFNNLQKYKKKYSDYKLFVDNVRVPVRIGKCITFLASSSRSLTSSN